jgi:hypothetical protein
MAVSRSLSTLMTTCVRDPCMLHSRLLGMPAKDPEEQAVLTVTVSMIMLLSLLL